MLRTEKAERQVDSLKTQLIGFKLQDMYGSNPLREQTEVVSIEISINSIIPLDILAFAYSRPNQLTDKKQ